MFTQKRLRIPCAAAVGLTVACMLGVFACDRGDEIQAPEVRPDGPEFGMSAASPVSMSYGDVTLTSEFQAGHFPHAWDLTKCDMTLSATYDGNGLVDDFGGDAHAWAELGIRAVGYNDFNPTWMTGGAGVWLATDFDWTANTFDPDPTGAPTQDMDDKLILQRGGGMGEGSYDLPLVPPNPWANHAVWFDRDGVDQWQADMWGAIDGVTYNTGGTYDVAITMTSTSATAGTAYMTVNGEPQGFYVPNWHAGPADLMPAGMNFTGDMTQQQVFYGIYGYGATHGVNFESISVEGCLADDPPEKDACKDGGWEMYGFRNQGQCIRFVNTGKDSR